MSREEESIYRRKPHISIILGRISTSANSVEMFQQHAFPPTSFLNFDAGADGRHLHCARSLRTEFSDATECRLGSADAEDYPPVYLFAQPIIGMQN